MKRKVIALVTALLVSGSVGAYAASGNFSAGTLPTAANCPQNAVTKVITAPASSSCPKSAAVSSAVQAALNQAKAANSCPTSGSNTSSKCNNSAAAGAVKSAQNAVSSYAPSANQNCPASVSAAAGQSCKKNSCTGNQGCTSNNCTNGTTCPKTNCTQGSNCGNITTYVYGSNSGSCSQWINSILNSIYGNCGSGTSGGTASKPASSAPASKPASSQTAGSSYSAFQNEVVRLVNVERAKNGLAALSIDATITKTATLKSQDMAKNNYFSHTSPTYGSPFDLMKQYGVSYRTAGENIAMGQTSPAQVMNGWMNSPGHRANILNSSYTKIGVGVAQNANGTYYWTQHFIG